MDYGVLVLKQIALWNC